MTTTLPPMSSAQTASWLGIMDLHERLHDGWTMIGGQMVHLHCAERGQYPPRPTDDLDAVVDVRADTTMLRRFTEALIKLGFASAGVSPEGLQHRWVRGEAVLDVLLPEGVGRRARSRSGAGQSLTLEAPGSTQALTRTRTVAVAVAGREGFIRRPNLVGAIIAAHAVPADPARRRHRLDFIALAALVTARDFAAEELTPKDRSRIRGMIEAVRADELVMAETPDAAAWLDRLLVAAQS